ncbi:VRR-NUC domain-containing protein [Vibrio cidicii]|uniref:VRR-NUC domain-containing protein n=1 Tax=Vibrio cidicii TaxID=1763883 RepID=UPI003750CD26
MDSSIELAPDYYLGNFCKLTHHAIHWYSDLLTKEELDWHTRFEQLSKPAQCLLVRLYSRKGCWFRSDKLNYAEIPDIAQALDELNQATLIELNPKVSHQELAAHLLTKPELLTLYPALPRALSKQALVEKLEDGEFHAFNLLSFSIIKLNAAQMIDVLLTLFFANSHQDLTQFVLDDLGLHQFEQYQLSEQRRFFEHREQIDHLIELSQLTSLYWQSDRKLKANLDLLLAALPKPVQHPYVERKRQHLLNDVARDYERLGECDLALSLFKQSLLPPSRERQARIYDKQEQNEAFSDIVTKMLEQPIDISELEIAEKLMQRVKRKQGLKIARKVKPTFQEHRLELNLSQQRVELAVKSYFEDQGWTVFYTENALLNGLLGLTLWPAIFAPIEGAFINPYQHRPLDLYHADFVRKRQVLIDKALEQIKNGDLSALFTTYEHKVGIANPLVNWSVFSHELLQQATKSIPAAMLYELFCIQLSDLKLYRNGMPDLVAFKDGQFEWIEVKGPGDKLQDNQWRWINEFQRLNVPFSVCYVNQ